MLFDLRSRRRRRVIKTVYVFLALLIGVGLVGFGVGTGGNFGGLFNTAGGGGGGPTGQDALTKTLVRAEKKAAKHSNDANAWAAVGKAAYNVAQLPSNFVSAQVSSSPGYTASGHKVLKVLKRAWNRYLSLSPAKPDQSLANAVAQAFGEISDFQTAETAQEFVAQQQPIATQYEYLAYLAYFANEPNRGDLAAARAYALAPKTQKAQVKKSLANFKAQAEQRALASQPTTTTTSTTATGTSSTSSTSTSTTKSSSGG